MHWVVVVNCNDTLEAALRHCDMGGHVSFHSTLSLQT